MVNIILGVVLIAAAIFLIVAVLMQEGKNEGLSGALSGASDSSFAKQKEQTRANKLSKLTSIVSIAFVIIVLLVTILTGIDANISMRTGEPVKVQELVKF